MNKKQSELKERTGSHAKGGKTRALLIERKQMTHSIFSLSFYLSYASIFGHLKESLVPGYSELQKMELWRPKSKRNAARAWYSDGQKVT